SGLEATFYNDGSKGRNRVVVQLASVYAESRYGITVLPQFGGFEGFSGGSFTSTEGTPAGSRVIPGTKRLPRASTIIEGEGFEDYLAGSTTTGSGNAAQRFVKWVPNALKDLLRLFIQHPLEFALLFLTFTLLATPPYLAYRRRAAMSVIGSTR
ncbi:MAG: hypothetical protein ACRDHK_14460, partial [Actinomycetota bacterium]